MWFLNIITSGAVSYGRGAKFRAKARSDQLTTALRTLIPTFIAFDGGALHLLSERSNW